MLKENCETHDYDLIRIIFDDFDYVFITKDTDNMKKLRPLLSAAYVNSTDNDISIFMCDEDDNTVINDNCDTLKEKFSIDYDEDIDIYE